MRSQLLQKYSLCITVCVTGACVLVIEILAIRILAPYFGSTMFTVSSILSVILGALAAGYWAGGRLADGLPHPFPFFLIVAVSGITTALFHAIGAALLPAWSSALPLTYGPLLFSFLLFFAPAFLLGLLSPYAVKLQSIQSPAGGVGSAAGGIFFWSTLGSIAGSLLAGFFLIPRFGTARIMLGTAALLFLLGLTGCLAHGGRRERRLLGLLAVLFAAALASVALAAPRLPANIRVSTDGVYEKILIYDGVLKSRPARFLVQDRSASGAMFLDTNNPADMVYDYTKYYRLYKLFAPEVKRALIIGGGAYTIPKALLAELPEAQVDVAEIEPDLFALATRYFGAAEHPRLRNFTEDGRRLLAELPAGYDLIIGDAYHSLYSLPTHLATQEFFALAKRRLTKGGMFLANVIGDIVPEPPSLLMAEMKTFQSVFPTSFFFAVDSPESNEVQNIIFVGVNGEAPPALNPSTLAATGDPLLQSLPAHRIDPSRFNFDMHPLLTDDFAPVEYLTATTLRRDAQYTSHTKGK
jgi:spermidine synthase